jgi:ABC-type transporter MlaC component
VTLNDGTEVDVEFLMIGRDGDWQVVDVVAEGVSYVRTYRSQFRVDIATEGLASVIEWLEAKAVPSTADASP